MKDRRRAVAGALLQFAAVLSFAARADQFPEDWAMKDRILLANGTAAYAGCAIDSSAAARRIAILRAEAKLASERSIVISGKEQLSKGKTSDDAGTLQESIKETAEAYVAPVTVVAETTVVMDGVLSRCVLIIEGEDAR